MKGSKKRIFFGIWNLDELASIIGAKLPYRVRYWITMNLIQDTKPKLPHFAAEAAAAKRREEEEKKNGEQ